MDKVENFEHAYPPEPLILVEAESPLSEGTSLTLSKIFLMTVSVAS